MSDRSGVESDARAGEESRGDRVPVTELGQEDFKFYSEHFDIMDPREQQLREVAIRELAVKCPITHSDTWGGFWVVNSYAAVNAVYHDWEAFSSKLGRAIFGRPANRPAMPPIDTDPPVQRDFRHILNPYLTPRVAAKFEPGIRSLVTELIDEFIEDGQCDLARQFSEPFPGRMLYRFLLGIDDTEVEMVQEWTNLIMLNQVAPEAATAQKNWNAWVYELVQRRREGPRQADIIDGLLHGTVDGNPLTDEEIVGSIQILILGGFNTTNDSILNTMYRLAEDRGLQDRLRRDPSSIDGCLDELLRFDSPISGQTRLCTRDTVIEGQKIKAGDRVFMFLAAANRDPAEFEDPNTLDVDRARNRHLAFGVGMHRCIGSNIARLNMRVALGELLSRLGQFRITPGDAPRHNGYGFAQWGYLPLTFTPGARVVAK